MYSIYCTNSCWIWPSCSLHWLWILEQMWLRPCILMYCYLVQCRHTLPSASIKWPVSLASLFIRHNNSHTVQTLCYRRETVCMHLLRCGFSMSTEDILCRLNFEGCQIGIALCIAYLNIIMCWLHKVLVHHFHKLSFKSMYFHW